MISLQPNQTSLNSIAFDSAEPALPESAQGKIQGLDAKVLPHAQSMPLSLAQEAPTSERSLEKMQACLMRSASPVLEQQARDGADTALLSSQAPQARMEMDGMRSTATMSEFGSHSSEETARRTSEYSENETHLLKGSGLGEDGGAEYRRLGLPITSQTIVTEHTAVRPGDMSELGKGAYNTTYALQYNGPKGVVEGVFKPLNEFEDGWVAERIGIDRNQPRIANRNLATQDVARHLGFDVVVECQIGCRGQPGGWQGVELGLLMRRAQGQTAAQTPASVFSDPQVRREITKLQLLDQLVGQGDRHSGNYFIHTYVDESGQSRAKVSGIDNDQCFGKNTLDINDICYSEDFSKKGFRGVQMPLLIDTDMAAAMRGMTPERLNALLSDKLDPQEIEATHARLDSMLKHIDRLEELQLIVTPARWDELTDADMSDVHQSDNSYFARDQENAAVDFN